MKPFGSIVCGRKAKHVDSNRVLRQARAYVYAKATRMAWPNGEQEEGT